MSGVAMNVGWEHQPVGLPDPEVGSGNSSVPVWPSSLLRELLDFHWAEEEYEFSTYASPYMARAEGIRYMGGTWDMLVLDWLGKPAAEVQDRLLSIAQDDELLDAQDVLHLRIHAGQFYDESRFWIELYNPFTFKREQMKMDQFRQFASDVLDLIQDFRNDKSSARAIDKKQDRFFRSHSGAGRYLASSSLALATFFAAKRIPLATIAYLLLHMERYAQVHACLNDLPDDGSGAQFSAQRLLALYG